MIVNVRGRPGVYPVVKLEMGQVVSSVWGN